MPGRGTGQAAVENIAATVVKGGRPDLIDLGYFVLVSGAGWFGGRLVRASAARDAAP